MQTFQERAVVTTTEMGRSLTSAMRDKSDRLVGVYTELEALFPKMVVFGSAAVNAHLSDGLYGSDLDIVTQIDDKTSVIKSARRMGYEVLSSPMFFKCMTLYKKDAKIDVTYSKLFHRMPVSEIIENAITKSIETSNGIHEVKVMDAARLIISKYDALYDRWPVERLGIYHVERKNHFFDMSKWFANYTTLATLAQVLSPLFTQDYANSRDAKSMESLINHIYRSVDVFFVKEENLLNRCLRKDEIKELGGLVRSTSNPELKPQSRLTAIRYMPQFLENRFLGLIK